MLTNTKNIKFFLISFLLSLPFWWLLNLSQGGLNSFEPSILSAQISKEKSDNNVFEKKYIVYPEITAKSAISVFFDPISREEKVIFTKNPDLNLPIASLTKLITAIIVLNYYDIRYANVEDLLYRLLIHSDNSSVKSLVKIIGEEAFLDLMNLEAKKIGLTKTIFYNATGIDPDNNNLNQVNSSNVRDLTKLSEYITLEKPLIWEISAIPNYKEKNNTNELLLEMPSIVVGGKTGFTDMAGQCLLLVVKFPEDKGYFINIVLGSNDRFGDMKKIINWIKENKKDIIN
jgi:D-alanyl-D-alanine carboxypeptidase